MPPLELVLDAPLDDDDDAPLDDDDEPPLDDEELVEPPPSSLLPQATAEKKTTTVSETAALRIGGTPRLRSYAFFVPSKACRGLQSPNTRSSFKSFRTAKGWSLAPTTSTFPPSAFTRL